MLLVRYVLLYVVALCVKMRYVILVSFFSFLSQSEYFTDV